MTLNISKEDIVGYECRFAVYCPHVEGDHRDLHTIKEIIHLKDGTTIPHLRMKENFKRPFWVTKKGFRNHQDKKEWEKKERVDYFECTQSELPRRVARALGEPWLVRDGRADMRRIARSPYVYGSDILSTAVIKRSYQDKWPQLVTPYSVATFDVETDVVHGTDEIMMATLAFKTRVVTVIQERFVAGHTEVIPQLRQKLQLYLGAMEKKEKDGTVKVIDFLAKRKFDWEVLIVPDEIDVVKHIFKRAHEWKPDFFAIWNLDFDIGRVLKALERARIDPAEVFSDPSVPPQYRYFKYKQGAKQKVTASGKVTPIKPSANWHTVFAPASFYVIDAMCSYRHIRTGSQEEPSYSLDAILEKNLGMRKLKFAEAEGLAPLEWHQFMQSKYPLEYVIYNVFDCISMEELDEKTTDLSHALPMFSGCSDFCHFKSQPRRLADSLHYFALNNGLVMGSTSDQMATDLDKLTVGLDGWIVTLPAHLVMDNGLRNILENQHQATNIRAHVGDLDVSASYPNGGAVFNISKETTHKEIISIEGVSEYQQRMQGINLSAGHVNAVEFCTNIFGLPQLDTLLEVFTRQQLEQMPEQKEELRRHSDFVLGSGYQPPQFD